MTFVQNFIFAIENSDRNKSGIYKISSNIDSRFYIGSAQKLWKRFCCHKNKLRLKIHGNPYLQSFHEKHTEAIFTFELLEFVEDENNLVSREQFWLDETKCYEHDIGFNICQKAYSVLGRIPSEATKDKVRGKNSVRWGVPHVRETKEKISKANMSNKSWSFRKNPSQIGLKSGPIKNSIPIVLLSQNGLFIKEFISIADASKHLKIAQSGIARVCKGTYKQMKGHYFQYKSDYLLQNKETVLDYSPPISFPLL